MVAMGALSACVSAPVRPDVAVAEARAAGEDLEVARLVGRYGPRAASYEDGLVAARRVREAEGRAWEALLFDALGRDAEAFEAWLGLLDAVDTSPALASAAALAVLDLVDRVPLGPTSEAPDAADPVPPLQRAMARPGTPGALAAEALVAVAARLAVDDPARSDSLAAAARERLGAISRYRLVGPRDDRPALARPEPLALSAVAVAAPGGDGGETLPGDRWVDCSRSGAVGLPPASHGVYSVIVDAPQRGRLEVEVVGDLSARVYAGGRPAASHPRLTAPLGERLRAVVDAPPSGLLEVQLAGRGFPEPIHIRVRAHSPEAEPRPLEPRLGRLLELSAAIHDRDPRRIADTSAALDRSVPLDALWLARAALADPDRPDALGRSQATAHLAAAIAAAPELGGARAALAELLLDEGARARASAVASAGPLGDHADRVQLQLGLAAGLTATADAEAHRARLPRSCEAAGRWLGAAWETLKLRGAPIGSLPRCFELELRGAMLLHAAWELDRARALLDDVVSRAAPGAYLGRALLARSRLAVARGELDQAASDARAARLAGAEPEQALELLLRVALLAGDDALEARVKTDLRETPGVSAIGRRSTLAPARDLGLPLADGLAIARSVEQEDPAEEEEGGGYEVLLDDLHTRVYPDGGMLHRQHRVLWLLTSTSVDAFGEVALPDEAEVLVARTWKPIEGGGWQPIEPEDLIEKTSISLPALERGAIAEIAWFWYQPPAARVAPGWRTPVFSFASGHGPTRRARWVLEAPPDAPLDVVSIAGGPTPERPGPGTLVFEAADRPRVLAEPLDPRPDRRIPGALVTSRFDPARLVGRLADEAATALAPSPALDALVDEALSGLDGGSDTAKLRALHAFVVSQIRDVDESPLAGRAAFAAARRAGERASLLTALCRAAGFDADLVLVRPLAYGLVDPTRFEADNYLYPVVRARVDGREVWLDTVNRFAPFDYLPPLVQGCDALALTPTGGLRVTTPEAPPEREGTRSVEVTLTVGPAAQTYAAHGEERITGVYAMSWRHALVDMAPERRVAVLGAIAQQSLPGARIDRVETSPLERRGEPLRVSWEARGTLAEQGPGSAALTVGLAPERLEQGTILISERTAPMLVNRSVQLDVAMTLRLSEGVTLRERPEPAAVTHPLMTLERTVAPADDGRGLTLRKRFSLSPGMVSPGGYAAWKDAVRAVDRADVVHLTLDVVPNTGGAGAPLETADPTSAALTR